MERLAFAGVEGAEHHVLGGGESAFGLGEPVRPLGGHLDDMAAAVVDRPPAGDQPLGLELVEQPDEVGRVDLQRRGERLLRAAAVVAQDRERDEVARAQAERRERAIRADASEPREMGEQRQGRKPDGVGRRVDAPSL